MKIPTIDFIQGLIAVAVGICSVVFCKPFAKSIISWNKKRWGISSNEKANIIIVAIVGIFFIIFGSLVVLGVIVLNS